MKCFIIVLATLCLVPLAMAGGSLGWDEASERLRSECPGLLSAIQQSFEVRPVGGALRLGPRSADVVEGRAEVGQRVPPFEFDCKPKGSPGPYTLRMEIREGDGDGWKLIIREIKPAKPTATNRAGAVEQSRE